MTNRKWLESLNALDMAKELKKLAPYNITGIVAWLRKDHETDEPETNEGNSVNHPGHYNTGGFECIDVMVAIFGKEVVKSFCTCNAFKYIWRHGKKNGREDIEKASWYLNKWVSIDDQ